MRKALLTFWGVFYVVLFTYFVGIEAAILTLIVFVFGVMIPVLLVILIIN